MYLMRLVCLGLAALALVPGVSRAQYPPAYCPPPAPSYYQAPARAPQPFVGASYSFSSPGTVRYYEPVYSSFYDPRLNPPRYVQPGPYWYTQHYPYTTSYYSYYYTPGYFRY